MTIADIVSLDRARRLTRDTSVVDRVVTYWPCRCCNTMVGVGQTGIDTLAMFNRVLRERRERPIAEREVMFCAPCAAQWHLDAQHESREEP